MKKRIDIYIYDPVQKSYLAKKSFFKYLFWCDSAFSIEYSKTPIQKYIDIFLARIFTKRKLIFRQFIYMEKD